MKRKRQQAKRRTSKKPKNSPASPEIVVKNLEIFVTDFLTDPCGLPLELKDCILVDGTKPSGTDSSFDYIRFNLTHRSFRYFIFIQQRSSVEKTLY